MSYVANKDDPVEVRVRRDFMKFKLSSVRHIPIIVEWDNEYYPWQVHLLVVKSLKFFLRLMRARRLGLEFSASRKAGIREEWDLWIQCYKPNLAIRSDLLVLDAGSGEGETLFFYYLLGLRRFRLVESDAMAFPILRRNASKLIEAKCELLNRTFSAEDVLGVDFAKIDVEGGEKELLKIATKSLPKEIVVETHDREIREQLQAHMPGMIFQHQLSETPETTLWRWLKE